MEDRFRHERQRLGTPSGLLYYYIIVLLYISFPRFLA